MENLHNVFYLHTYKLRIPTVINSIFILSQAEMISKPVFIHTQHNLMNNFELFRAQ